MAAILLFVNLWTLATVAPASPPGAVICQATENGAATPAAQLALTQNGTTVASGTCGSPMQVPAGTYNATITLTGALDRPSRTVTVVVPSGGQVAASASFATAILEVEFTAGGQPAFGTAILRKDGRDIGTLGSRLPVRVSAGTYELVARYRTASRTFVVPLAAGQRRAIRAAF